MITEALQHCAGIGPARLAVLHDSGVRSWSDVLEKRTRIPRGWRGELAEECRRCLNALESGDIKYFAENFAPKDRWRIVEHFLDQASFFDIETAGLEYDAAITVIGCWHKGRLHSFVEHENLDDFLELLEHVRLLISFNGSSFDVPRVLDTFHIPQLPCAHIDLRWPCYHQGLKGGLKEITRRIGITRPADLTDADGELAVALWAEWLSNQNAAARDKLVRYCASDVLILIILAQWLVGRTDLTAEDLWDHLPASHSPPAPDTGATQARIAIADGAFGHGSPTQLRARRQRLVG